MHSWLNHLPILPVNETIVLAQQSHPPPFIHLADSKGEEPAVTMDDNKIHSVPNTIEQISYNLSFELESCLLTIGIYSMARTFALTLSILVKRWCNTQWQCQMLFHSTGTLVLLSGRLFCQYPKQINAAMSSKRNSSSLMRKYL